MSELKILDLKLGDSLECLVQAVNEAKNLDQKNGKKIQIQLARTIAQLWEIRNNIYGIDPSAKPDLVRESDQNGTRCKELTLMQNSAYKREQEGNIETASKLYGELLDNSQYGYFQRIAEAGLYRTQQEIKRA